MLQTSKASVTVTTAKKFTVQFTCCAPSPTLGMYVCFFHFLPTTTNHRSLYILSSIKHPFLVSLAYGLTFQTVVEFFEIADQFEKSTFSKPTQLCRGSLFKPSVVEWPTNKKAEAKRLSEERKRPSTTTSQTSTSSRLNFQVLHIGCFKRGTKSLCRSQ